MVPIFFSAIFFAFDVNSLQASTFNHFFECSDSGVECTNLSQNGISPAPPDVGQDDFTVSFECSEICNGSNCETMGTYPTLKFSWDNLSSQQQSYFEPSSFFYLKAAYPTNSNYPETYWPNTYISIGSLQSLTSGNNSIEFQIPENVKLNGNSLYPGDFNITIGIHNPHWWYDGTGFYPNVEVNVSAPASDWGSIDLAESICDRLPASGDLTANLIKDTVNLTGSSTNLETISKSMVLGPGQRFGIEASTGDNEANITRDTRNVGSFFHRSAFETRKAGSCQAGPDAYSAQLPAFQLKKYQWPLYGQPDSSLETFTSGEAGYWARTWNPDGSSSGGSGHGNVTSNFSGTNFRTTGNTNFREWIDGGIPDWFHATSGETNVYEFVVKARPLLETARGCAEDRSGSGNNFFPFFGGTPQCQGYYQDPSGTNDGKHSCYTHNHQKTLLTREIGDDQDQSLPGWAGGGTGARLKVLVKKPYGFLSGHYPNDFVPNSGSPAQLTPYNELTVREGEDFIMRLKSLRANGCSTVDSPDSRLNWWNNISGKSFTRTHSFPLDTVDSTPETFTLTTRCGGGNEWHEDSVDVTVEPYSPTIKINVYGNEPGIPYQVCTTGDSPECVSGITNEFPVRNQITFDTSVSMGGNDIGVSVSIEDDQLADGYYGEAFNEVTGRLQNPASSSFAFTTLDSNADGELDFYVNSYRNIPQVNLTANRGKWSYQSKHPNIFNRGR